MTSNTLTLTPVNGEPRVKDLTLAEKLGFSDQYMIRKLIKRNEPKLLSFGILSTVETIHKGAGRPTAEFYLNQKQAIFICMKSETDKAFDVQAEIVRVFDAYLNGAPTVVHQPRLHRDLSHAVRVFDLAKDLFAKQMMVYAIRDLAGKMGLPTPDFAAIGKSADQMPLEF